MDTNPFLQFCNLWPTNNYKHQIPPASFSGMKAHLHNSQTSNTTSEHVHHQLETAYNLSSNPNKLPAWTSAHTFPSPFTLHHLASPTNFTLSTALQLMKVKAPVFQIFLCSMAVSSNFSGRCCTFLSYLFIYFIISPQVFILSQLLHFIFW